MFGFGPGRNEAQVLGIVDVVTTAEEFGPQFWTLKQVPYCWNGTVVEIRSPQPGAIERNIYVTLRKANGREVKWWRVYGFKPIHKVAGPHPEEGGVGADLFEGRCLACIG